MKNKLNLILLFLVMATLLSFAIVSAATVINTPAASSTISGSTTFNVTVTEDMGANLVNLTFYLRSASTANSSWSNIGTNNSLNLTLLSNRTITRINISGMIEDSNDYILNVTAANATSGTVISEDTNTDITIDQTAPTAATSLSPSDTSVSTNGTLAFSGTVTARQTTSCTLFFDGTNPGASSYAMTHSGSTCSYTLNSVNEQAYKWYIRASDGTNTTDSSIITAIVDISSGGLKGYVGDGEKVTTTTTTIENETETEEDKTNWTLIIIMGVIFVIGFIIYRRNY